MSSSTQSRRERGVWLKVELAGERTQPACLIRARSKHAGRVRSQDKIVSVAPHIKKEEGWKKALLPISIS